MTAEQIAADVSARYGLPVMDGAFTRCPPNTYTWQIEGVDDTPPSWKEMRQISHANRSRTRRGNGASDGVSEVCIRMYLDKKPIREIAAVVEISPKAVRERLKRAKVHNPQQGYDAQVNGAKATNDARSAAQEALQAIRVAQTQEGRSTGRVGADT